MLEQFGNLPPVQVHGRRNDVIGRLIAQLHDVLAQIGLPHGNAKFFQRRSKLDLFGHHGLGFDHRAHIPAGGKIADVVTGLLGIGGPKDMATVSDDLFFKLKEIAVQMVDGLALDLLAALARRLPIVDAGASAKVGSLIAIHAAAEDFAMDQVGRFHRRILEKFLRRGAHGFSCAKILARWMVRAGAPRLPRIP